MKIIYVACHQNCFGIVSRWRHLTRRKEERRKEGRGGEREEG